MNLSQKAKKAVAAGLALSTMVWSVSLFAAPFAAAAPHNDGCLVNVSGTVYLITGGQKRGFTSAEVFTSHGYNFGQVVTANSDDAALPTGPILIYADGTLVKGPSDPLVYLVVNGQKRGFTSGSVFTGLGYSFANIQWAPVNTFNDIPTGANIDSTAITGLPASGPGPKTVTCTTTSTPGLTGEGSVESITVGSPDKVEISEGQNDVELVAFDVKLSNDGSLKLDRFDLYMGQDDNVTASNRPWDYFTEAVLMVNGSEVASMDVDSSNAWTKYDFGGGTLATTSQEYRLRFSGLNSVLASGETSVVSVAFSAHNNMDSADEDAVWQFGTVADSFRFEDATGFVFTEGADLASSFAWSEADVAKLEVSDADDKVVAQVIQVSTSSNTNGVHVYSFDIEETNDVDANIEEMTLTFTTTGTTTENTVIRRASLWQGNTKVSQDETVADGGVVVFDNLDIDVDADDSVTLDVKVDLYDNNSGARYIEGTTLAVAFTDIDVVTDAYGNDEGDITVTGTPSSNTHSLRSEGIQVEFVSATQEKTFAAGAAGENDRGTFEITFDVTAFGADMRIDRSSEEGGADAAGQGVEFVITNSGSNSVTSLLTSTTSDTEDNANVFEVDKGTTRRFTLQVVATASANHFAEVSIESINWGTATNDTNANYYTFNLNDFKTGALNLVSIPNP